MYHASLHAHTLQFRFVAGTSRGTLTTHTAHYVRLFDPKAPERVGIGEAAPLAGLSLDAHPDFAAQAEMTCRLFAEENFSIADIPTVIPHQLPSLRFAFEVALRDLAQGGRRLIYANDFAAGRTSIPINGLIWMGDLDFMAKQIEQKLNEGYRCLKLKIGALNFDSEYALLADLRRRFSSRDLILRVDANGAFSPEQAPQKLERLHALELHSIEQPIAAGTPEQMYALCQNSPLPIALDEELIGCHTTTDRAALLDQIQPAYIVLKPTLLGGLAATADWIRLAEERQIGWWITSALESNIGLNAIAQFVAQYAPQAHQGLGTGQLYHNNIPSPLEVASGYIRYLPERAWDSSQAVESLFLG